MNETLVNILIAGGVMKIVPPASRFHNHCIQTVMGIARFELNTTDENTGRQVKKIIQLGELMPDSTIEMESGLAMRVRSVLRTLGYNVNTHVRQFEPLHVDVNDIPPDIMQSFMKYPQQYDCVKLVLTHPEHFIIECPPGWGKTHLITHMCRMLHRNNVAIVLPPPKELVSNLADRLESMCVAGIGMVGDGHNTLQRITITTQASMHKLAGTQWDIVFVDEAHKFASDSAAETFNRVFPHAKRIGLTASPLGRSDNADMMVEALFGGVLYRVTYQQAVDAGMISPIDVWIFNVPSGPAIKSKDPTVINRLCVWRNQQRNTLIANIARRIPQDEQVLIIVSTTEHALYLRALLPDFETVFSTVSNDDVIGQIEAGVFGDIPGYVKSSASISDEHRANMKSRFEAGTLRKVIATGIWNTGVSFNQLTYLIRAEAMGSGTQAIQTPGRLSRKFEGKEKGILIDFADQFNKQLYRRFTKRVKWYKEQNWQISVKIPSMLPPPE